MRILAKLKHIILTSVPPHLPADFAPAAEPAAIGIRPGNFEAHRQRMAERVDADERAYALETAR